MNFVQATEAPERRTAEIKLYDPAAAFAGMAKAGQVAAG